MDHLDSYRRHFGVYVFYKGFEYKRKFVSCVLCPGYLGLDEMEKTIKIALTGPESTGKSTLGIFLADYFNAIYVEEYARKYLEQGDGSYEYKDILEMAKNQKALEDAASEAAAGKQLVFLDTEWINYKIWLEYKGYEVPQWLIHGIAEANYKMYLLMYPDIPWAQDKLREYPQLRMFFFEKFKSELENFNKPYEIIKGTGKEREENALKLVNKFYF